MIFQALLDKTGTNFLNRAFLGKVESFGEKSGFSELQKVEIVCTYLQ